MTIEERAEKIVASMGMSQRFTDVLERMIAAQIREAVQEARPVFLGIDRKSTLGQELLIRAKAEAYEDAAKIVDPGFGCSPERHELALKIRAHKDALLERSDNETHENGVSSD